MIHVVTGPPCAGKSTYIREHAAEGDVVVDYDALAHALGRKEVHVASLDGSAPNIAAFEARAAVKRWAFNNYDSDSANVWIIETNLLPGLESIYERVGAEIVKLDTDMETCLQRAADDDRPPGTEDAIREWFDRQAPKGAFFMPTKGGQMNLKTKTVEAKADGDNGSIVGYAATWTREPDSYGDVIVKGAFAESIAAIKAEGKVIPLLWNHDSYNLNSYIGTVTDLEEDDHGLKFAAMFDSTDEAQRARELAMDGRLCKFSFAYDVLEQAEIMLDENRRANELRKLNIHEVSLVMYPANRDTSVVEVKGATVTVKAGTDEAIAKSIEDATGLVVQNLEYKASVDALPEVTITAIAPNGLKAGRRNSKADEDALREVLESCADITEEVAQIQSTINGLIDAGAPADDPDGQGQNGEAKSEEPPTVNGEEPAKANPEEPETVNEEELKAKAAELEQLLQQANDILNTKGA